MKGLGTRILKIVRDRIPDLIHDGPWYYVPVPKDEQGRLLRYKLQEEVAEYLEDRVPEELADIIEACFALGIHEHHLYPHELVRLADEKRALRGGYKELFAIEIREGEDQEVQ
jgi:predicted house-cleaning noncanonical NTP pyrophosphatase (MazG superfamily)